MDVKRDLYILCGGESKRMGRDKSQLLIHGRTFLKHLTDRVNPVFKSVTLLRGKQSFAVNLPQIPDAITDVGPLGGLLAALQDTKADSISILPVDLPFISDETLNLLNSPIPNILDARLARSKDRIQPLVGVYHVRIISKLEDYLRSGWRSVLGLIEDINCGYFSVSEHEIKNINTPEDYRKFFPN